MGEVIELPNRGKIVVILYEVSDTQGIAIWGGENPVEALFLRKDFPVDEVENTRYPIKGLDFPNYNGREDYVLDWWIS